MTLGGCYPSLEADRYYHYELAVEADGQRRDFQQDFTCHPLNEWSEGDGKFHLHWYFPDVDAAAVDIGNDRTLMYIPRAICDGADQQDLMQNDSEKHEAMFINTSFEHPLFLFRPASTLSRMQIFTKALADPPIRVLRQSVTRVRSKPDHLGPSVEQAVGIKRLRGSDAKFYRVIEYEIPQDMWATTDAARQYFGQFQTVTLAPPSVFRTATFPYARDRRSPGDGHAPVVRAFLELHYDGMAFDTPTPSAVQSENWYRVETKPITAPGGIIMQEPVPVRFRGEDIQITGTQEVFDPQHQTIVVFIVLSNPLFHHPKGGIS